MRSERFPQRQGSICELVAAIKSQTLGPKCTVIAISGFVGAGKSTTARKLSADLDDAQIICIDEFIVNHMEDNPHCWDGVDWLRLKNEVLFPANDGCDSIEYGVYDWTENIILKHQRFPIPKFLIVEGVGLLRPELMPYFNHTIWLDVPIEIAGARAIKRDKEKYHIESDEYWINSWSVNDREYFDLYKPIELADSILCTF